MKIERTLVFGFEPAIRGMRNPKDSWDRSDSKYNICGSLRDMLGEADLMLMKRLIAAGAEHRKFLRMIQIWVDFTLPRYVWTELDTYKVATVRNSCSTMNKLGTRDLTQDDFQLPIPDTLLAELNELSAELRGLRGSAKRDARHELKNLLPEGFLQKATYMFNYETALIMFHQRKKHRLPEWRYDAPGSLCRWLADLPYFRELFDID